MLESAALQAARKGRTALETFQRAHPEDTLDFRDVDFRNPQNEHIQFSDFEFVLGVDFQGAKFGNTPIPFQVHGHPSGRGSSEGAALFQKTIFHKHALFAKAEFGNDSRFDDTIFKADAVFGGAEFGNTYRKGSSLLLT